MRTVPSYCPSWIAAPAHCLQELSKYQPWDLWEIIILMSRRIVVISSTPSAPDVTRMTGIPDTQDMILHLCLPQPLLTKRMRMRLLPSKAVRTFSLCTFVTPAYFYTVLLYICTLLYQNVIFSIFL